MTKGESTRQNIIQSAAPLFNRQGYAGTSMQDIMAATGLEKGGLYRHFSSKQELSNEAFLYTLEGAFSIRFGHLDDVPDPMDKLRGMIHAFVEHPSPVAGGCPLLNAGVDADDTNPELLRLVAGGLQKWKSWITDRIKAGQKNGSVRQETHPSRLANQIVSTPEGALLICCVEKDWMAMRDAQALLDRLLQEQVVAPVMH